MHRRALALQHPGEAVGARGCVWVMRPQSLLVDGKGALALLLRFAELACTAMQEATHAFCGLCEEMGQHMH